MIFSWRSRWRKVKARRLPRGGRRYRAEVEQLEVRNLLAAVGNVTPTAIGLTLNAGDTATRPVSLTLPATGPVVTAVDVFLLFDDTGSFAGTAPTLTAQFPTIIAALTAALPGISFAFGVGRFEDFGGTPPSGSGGNPNDRPFILSQPVLTTTTAGFNAAIAAALGRSAPGSGGDGPESLLEGLFQTATGVGFDGNNNGSRLDSGPAGLARTQTNPGAGGDVPPFSSFTADPPNNVLPPSGTLGGVGFRPGALPIILAATDTGTVYQPDGRTTITGVGGVSVPLADLTSASRATTPFGMGTTFQATIDALTRLGALVIGLGTNNEAAAAPRRTLEAIARLTGAVNGSTTAIDSGIGGDPIAPGDPFYFRITAGSGPNVAAGIRAAIEAAVTRINFDISLRPTDPTVGFENLTGVRRAVPPGGTAAFDARFTGDGRRHEFDLQFVRDGTTVVLGSIPVVITTTGEPPPPPPPPPPVAVVLPTFLGKTELLGSNTGGPEGNLIAQAVYVNGVYLDLLGRLPDQAGLDGWVQLLQAGVPRAQVAASIWRSAEHRGRQVDAYFADFLKRAPDAAGRAFWVNAFRAGATEEVVARSLLTSPEYLNRSAADADFVSGLYADVVGRPGDAAGRAFYEGRLAAGVSRAAVAGLFLDSAEALRRVVGGYYGNFLDRGLDPAGDASWVGLLLSRRLNQEQVGEAVLASAEYFRTHSTLPTP